MKICVCRKLKRLHADNRGNATFRPIRAYDTRRCEARYSNRLGSGEAPLSSLWAHVGRLHLVQWDISNKSLLRLKLQELHFASGLKAIYVTLKPQMRADLNAVTQPHAPLNSILALRWRFEPVKHLYPKYIPPPGIIPPDLPPDTMAAYLKALSLEFPVSESAKLAPAEGPSDPDHPILAVNGIRPVHDPDSAQHHEPKLAPDTLASTTPDVNYNAPGEDLRKQANELRAKLESIRRELEDKTQVSPQHLVDEIHQAEKELKYQLRTYRKVSDSVADLKHDIRHRDSTLRAEKKGRRQMEREIADAQNAAAGKADARADTDQHPSDLAKLRTSRDHLKHLIGVREAELKKRQETRQLLEDELGRLKLARAGSLTVVGGESSAPPAVPAVIQAFSHLRNTTLQD